MTELRMNSLNPKKWVGKGKFAYAKKTNALGLHLVAEKKPNGWIIVDRVSKLPEGCEEIEREESD